MLVYFDESYACKDKLLLGALFLPSKKTRSWLHCSFSKLKKSYDFFDKSGKLKEIKYNEITNNKKLEIAKKAVDLFTKCPDAYFRACVIPYNQKELDKVGRQKGIPVKLKEAMLYTNSAYKLLQNTIPEVREASLMMDEITRARGDKFDEIIRDKIGSGEKAIFSHISYVSSKAERTHTIQICDLLLGAILNEHYPTTKVLQKNEFREYVKSKIAVTSLKQDYWGKMQKKEADSKHPKYNIRFWGVPYQYLSL